MTPIAFPHLRDPRINAYLAAPRGLSQLCHVFHRLLTPKHPPCTLSYLVYLLRSILDYTSRLVFNDPVNFEAEVASTPEWWRRRGSNPRPLACKASALPAELRPQWPGGGPMWI